MGDVVSIESVKPHLQGPCKCIRCGHEWRGVMPVGVFSGLECPSCGADMGATTGEVLPETTWVCDCGCDVYSLTPEGPMCRNCGVYALDYLEEL